MALPRTSSHDIATHTRSAALLSWLNTLDLEHKQQAGGSSDAIEAYSSPERLLAVLQSIDSDAFQLDFDQSQEAQGDKAGVHERKLRLEQLHNAILRYFSETLSLATGNLPVIDIDAIAEESSEIYMCSFVTLVLSLAVLSPTKEAQISKIQSMPEWVQRELMLCIENTRSKLSSPDPSSDFNSSSFTLDPVNDSEAYATASFTELRTAHQTLEAAYAALAAKYDEEKQNHSTTIEQLNLATEGGRAKERNNDFKADLQLKTEVDRLQHELSRTETIIANSEATTGRQEKTIDELTKRLEELSVKAEQADRLKDEMDEYRHASEKVRKLEVQADKYKKKLEEAAEAKRQLKALEEENVDLLEKNGQLEEEYRQVSTFKSLMEDYKKQLEDLESKKNELQKQNQDLNYQLEESKRKAERLTEDSERERESVELLEERVRELESSGRKPLDQHSGLRTKGPNGSVQTNGTSASASDSDREEESELSGMADELDNAITGTTTTELKLQIRRLKRDLESAQANKVDASRILVLENLLEDSQKMKTRYEKDYLNEHREKLVAVRQLEEIRAGKPASKGDSAEVAIALRIRLAETVDELERLRKDLSVAQDQQQTAEKDLKIAKSDLSLVNKDQLEALSSLRASVSIEKAGLEQELIGLKANLQQSSQANAMQLSQINTLLLDKVSLQSDGLTQRDRLLERARSVQGPVLKEEATEAALEKLREKVQGRQKELDDTKEKLQKARLFIRQQDRLFKDRHAALASSAPEDALQASYKSQIFELQKALEKQQALTKELEERFSQEQRLMLRAWQEAGMHGLKSSVLLSSQQNARQAPLSWLAQQRAKATSRISG